MWRPRKVSQGTTDPTPESASTKRRRETSRKTEGYTKPTIITVEQRWGRGEIKKWGPLSKTTAWRAGSFWEESICSIKVFLDKDGRRVEVVVEKLVGKGGPRFWFSEKTPKITKKHKVKRRTNPSRKQKTNQSPKKLTPVLTK